MSAEHPYLMPVNPYEPAEEPKGQFMFTARNYFRLVERDAHGEIIGAIVVAKLANDRHCLGCYVRRQDRRKGIGRQLYQRAASNGPMEPPIEWEAKEDFAAWWRKMTSVTVRPKPLPPSKRPTAKKKSVMAGWF